MKSIITQFLTWRILLILIALISISVIPLRTGFLGGGTENYLKNPLLWGWANMDGVHYLSIAQNGYFQYEQAFFPLYPILIRIIGNILGGNFLFAGLLISNGFFLLGLSVLYKLLIVEGLKSNSKWIIGFLLLFPTSFFFGSVYTEGPFFFLTVTFFYFLKQKKWWLCGLVGFFTGLTRLPGIFLSVVLIYEIWVNNKNRFKISNFLPVILCGSGLLLYMGYLYSTVHDPLFFFHVQPIFGANRSGNEIIFLPQVLFRYIKIFLTASISYDYFIALLEFVSFGLATYMLIKHRKKIPVSYQIFSWLVIITPTLTGSLSSFPRYFLNIFPLFIALSFESRRMKILLLAVSIPLLVICTIFYFRGYFIA
jgi:hypothetical protein